MQVVSLYFFSTVVFFIFTGDLSKGCITLLWERFTLALPDTTEAEAKAALTLLVMAAKLVHYNLK